MCPTPYLAVVKMNGAVMSVVQLSSRVPFGFHDDRVPVAA